MEKRKYLVALPTFPNDKGFNHKTVLVKAENESDAIDIVKRLKPSDNIGSIKEVKY